MKCPHCNIPLLMTDRKGVEIDYCSQCRGVWLDRGELDKIIDLSVNDRTFARTNRQSAGGHHNSYANQESTYRDRHQPNSRNDYYEKDHSRYHKPYGKYKKKKSLLGEVFDIFD